ncbi:ATP-binding protein [Massilia pseudoviolaceinigra]|uniref:ATP-binding protein n=1 Tax=Massilia pseudoviolaceinigra TaxID=3057165 RepID=UPI0027969422|nr:ATP-binding protein [Massilia sp. CCM 9206]MDQ1918948.1 ATP-binding protein [Massilia sp. CCM 9206]
MLTLDHPLFSQLHDVCENATVALFAMDEQQHCVYMNPAAQALTGYRLEEVQGAPLHDFIHHLRADGTPYPLAECPIDRAAPARLQERGRETFIHRDGTAYPVEFTASPVHRDGKLVGTVLEVQDARPRQQQEGERTALQEISALILEELDREKIVQAVTDAATRLTGAQFGAFFYNVTDEAGESYTLYTISGVPKEHFTQFPLPRATGLFGPTFRGEATIRSDDVRHDPRYGKMGPHFGMPEGHLPVRSYLAVPVSLGSGEVVGGLFFGHAKTAQFTASHETLVEVLAAQAALGLKKAALYQEALFARKRAEQDAIEKQRLYEEAARANNAKDYFLATVSHELRTPLTSILGWAQMLGSGKLNDTQRARAVVTIERNARVQAQIVEDLLDISRIVSGKLRLAARVLDPHAIVEAALDAIRPAALAKQIEVRFSSHPLTRAVSADPERLQQIVWNLVSNAVKFSQPGGAVEVSLDGGDQTLAIRVCDYGAGIPEAFLPRIFDNFSQLDPSSTRQHGGLGLGLAIVKQLVELHAGTVRAYSAGAGRGAEFTVTLPLAAGAAGSADGAGHPADTTAALGLADPGRFGLQGAVILLVEDDDDAREMLASVLHSAQALVQPASNAHDALLLFESGSPDLLVSDIGMPGMDGLTFIDHLRKRERALGRAAVPALALTAFASVHDRMKALEHGYQMHVAKPVQPAELLAVLSSLRSWKGNT